MKKILVSLALVMASTSLWAQEIPAKEEIKGTRSEGLANLKLAADLVKYGYQQEDALSLLMAAQIIGDTDSQKLEAEKSGENPDMSDNTGKKGFVTLDRDKILADAKKFTNGDKDVESLIAKTENEAKGVSRGAVGGPCKDYAAVKAYSSYTWTCNFYADRLAEVLVSGDGDTDLDLYVYDSNGNLIDSDTDYTDDCYVSWVPRWTGKFYIKIVNRGGVFNRYVIVTN